MKRSELARREFLMRALAACGAPYLVHVRDAEAGQDRARQTTAQRVAMRYFGSGNEDAGVEAIGEAYLRQLGLDRTEDAILGATTNTLELITGSPTETRAIRALVQAVRNDFRNQRAVQLEGWILSRTEVELCLLALLPLTD